MLKQSVAHYNILERLGGGALGDVYRARDTEVGRTVALMQPPPELVSDPLSRARFVADARAAITLNHPNIAALFDVVEQDGRCYLAYEFVPGPSLRQEMAGQHLGVRRALEVAAQIADALAEGHARGIVHGDLRPDTVVVTPRGSTKILNFGMVPWTAAGAARRTIARAPYARPLDHAPGAGVVTPDPIDGVVGVRSDLFSLGVMLHEMVTGKPPVEAGPVGDEGGHQVPVSLVPASAHNPDVPPAFDALLARAMSDDLAARHQTAASLAAALRSVTSLLDTGTGRAAPGTLIPLDDSRAAQKWWIAAILAGGAAGSWWLSR